MQRLRELGVKQTVMLTGDNKVNADTIAREAGIGRVEANLLPSQKMDEEDPVSSLSDKLAFEGFTCDLAW